MKQYPSFLLASITAPAAADQVTPIVEYLFSVPNETLQVSTGTGNDNGARLSIRDSLNVAAPLTSEVGHFAVTYAVDHGMAVFLRN